MPQHPDNMSPIEKGIIQMEQLFRECFRMAERLMKEEGRTDSFETTEARERSQAIMPLIAMDIKNQIIQMVGIEHAPQNRVDESQASHEAILKALKARNDQAEKS